MCIAWIAVRAVSATSLISDHLISTRNKNCYLILTLPLPGMVKCEFFIHAIYYITLRHVILIHTTHIFLHIFQQPLDLTETTHLIPVLKSYANFLACKTWIDLVDFLPLCSVKSWPFLASRITPWPAGVVPICKHTGSRRWRRRWCYFQSPSTAKQSMWLWQSQKQTVEFIPFL